MLHAGSVARANAESDADAKADHGSEAIAFSNSDAKAQADHGSYAEANANSEADAIADHGAPQRRTVLCMVDSRCIAEDNFEIISNSSNSFSIDKWAPLSILNSSRFLV
jgi:hypothetical protein